MTGDRSRRSARAPESCARLRYSSPPLRRSVSLSNFSAALRNYRDLSDDDDAPISTTLHTEQAMLSLSGRYTRLAVTLSVALAVAACQRNDPRVEQLTRGISRDSSLVILNDGTAPAAGTLPHAFSSGDMLVNGANYTVLYYSSKLAEGQTAADVRQRDVTPLIIQNGTLVGWGWEFFNNMASQTHFATPEFSAD